MFYLISSFVGAVIGYITNYIAIKMLFRPYKARKLGNITIIPQGVIPKEKANLAKNVANVVENHLLDKEELHKLITSDKFKTEIQNMISAKIDEFEMPNITEIIKANPQKIAESISDFVMQMIASKFPFATAMISEEMIKNMVLENMDLLTNKINAIFDIEKVIDKEKIKQNLQNEAINFLENESYKVIQNLEIGKIVENRVNSFDERKLENMLFSLMDKHFKFINIAGAFLGAIIGLIQAFVLLHLK
jgi:uncharacterized membrane protein YheB (UPF0754 family)